MPVNWKLPMALSDYQLQWSSDAEIHIDELEIAAANVPYLHAKWWKIYTAERLKLKKLDFEYKVLYRQRWEWYAGKLSDDERLHLKWDPQPLKILTMSPNRNTS